MQYFATQSGGNNIDNGAAALTLEAIDNINADLVTKGGMADTIVVGIAKARELNALVSANYSSQRLADWSQDKGSVTRLPSDLPLMGNVTNIVVDSNINDNELYIYESGKIQVIPMAAGNGSQDGNWAVKDATQNGQDGERVRVLGDFGMKIRDAGTHMARLHNIG